MRTDEERLRDILEASARVQRYTSQGRAAFDQSELIQTWMLHNLQLIGEAARSLSSEFREAHPEIPWTAIIGMLTILVHHHFEIDENAVWIAADRDVPPLASAVAAILANSSN